MRPGAKIALASGLALALANYFPVLAGRVPFPADVILNFPPWEEARGGAALETRHAEMADLAAQVYPWRVFAKHSLAAGELPLWNPHVLLGVPFVAGAQTAVFYPPHLLYHLLPAPTAWAVLQPLRMVLAVIFAAALARSLGASALGGAATGIAFASCGFMVAWQGWAHVDSAVWIPAAMLATQCLHRRSDGPRVALLAATLAMAVLGGHPEAAVYAALGALAMAAQRLAFPHADAAPRPRFAAAFVLSAGLGGLLAAIQILPTLEWLPSLVRPADAFVWPTMPLERAFAFLSRDAASNPNPAGFDVPEGAVYVGILSLLLAPLALLQLRKVDAFFAVLWLAVGLQLAYGFGPAYRLALLVPLLRTMPHDRAIVLVDLALALLAGLGLSELERRSARAGRPALAIAALGVIATSLALLHLALSLDAAPRAMAGTNGLFSTAAILIASCGLLAARLLGPLSGGRFAIAAMLLLAADLVGYSFGHVPFFRAEQVYPEPPLVEKLREAEPLYRVVSLDNTAPPNMEMVFALHTPAGQDYVMRGVSRVVGAFTGDESPFLPAAFRAELVTARPGRLLDLLGVKRLVATTYNESASILGAQPERFRLVHQEAEIRVFENRNALPRAFLVPRSGIRIETGEPAWATLLSPAFDPAAAVLLPSLPRFPPDDAPTPENRVARFVSRVNTLRIEVEAAAAAVLVLTDTHYPGWRARLDGRDVLIEQADLVFRGVAIPAGRHSVSFDYEPASFRTGALLSIAGLALCLVASIRWRPA